MCLITLARQPRTAASIGSSRASASSSSTTSSSGAWARPAAVSASGGGSDRSAPCRLSTICDSRRALAVPSRVPASSRPAASQAWRAASRAPTSHSEVASLWVSRAARRRGAGSSRPSSADRAASSSAVARALSVEVKASQTSVVDASSTSADWLAVSVAGASGAAGGADATGAAATGSSRSGSGAAGRGGATGGAATATSPGSSSAGAGGCEAGEVVRLVFTPNGRCSVTSGRPELILSCFGSMVPDDEVRAGRIALIFARV